MAVYVKYAEGPEPEDSIGLFHCKCAVLELLGVQLTKRALKEILLQCCPLSLKSGLLSLDDFISVFVLVRDARPPGQDLRDMYDVVDPTGKGFITEDDFLLAMSAVAPRIAASRGAEIYRSLDTYDIGKVCFKKTAIRCKIILSSIIIKHYIYYIGHIFSTGFHAQDFASREI